MASPLASLLHWTGGARQSPRDWGEGALIALVLHIALAALVLLAVRATIAEGEGQGDIVVDLDMTGEEPPPLPQPNRDAGGGGAGGAIKSPVPLPPDTPRLGPVVPPDKIEPVKGAPVARTSGSPPVGYGPGFGGGQG
ncbi:MAG: hypothetical protein IE933_11175, partial [Sphingomonadales bacterium]|nr:hypothetical protein [Sphingomonadales bacterium]